MVPRDGDRAAKLSVRGAIADEQLRYLDPGACDVALEHIGRAICKTHLIILLCSNQRSVSVDRYRRAERIPTGTVGRYELGVLRELRFQSRLGQSQQQRDGSTSSRQ